MRWQMALNSIQGCTGSGGSACSRVAAETQDWAAPWELPFVLMSNTSHFCLYPNPPPFFFSFQFHTVAWQWFLTRFPFCSVGNHFALLQFLGEKACIAFPYWPSYLCSQQQYWQCWKLGLLIKLVLPLLAGCQRPWNKDLHSQGLHWFL